MQTDNKTEWRDTTGASPYIEAKQQHTKTNTMPESRTRPKVGQLNLRLRACVLVVGNGNRCVFKQNALLEMMKGLKDSGASIHGPLGYEPNTLATAPVRW